jgi:Domain of unknown function (DUF4160)
VPTVHRERGFDVRIYLPPREREPPHVHVVKKGFGEVKIHLGTKRDPPHIERIFGLRDADVTTAYRIVLAHQARLLREWRKYHG